MKHTLSFSLVGAVILAAQLACPASTQTTWTERLPATHPTARTGVAAFDAARERIVIFGGSRTTGEFGDTWTWDGSVWSSMNPISSPSPRTAHELVLDESSNRVLLFGGAFNIHHGSTYFAETWEWDGSDWNLRNPQTNPPARAWAASAYDALRQQVVLFGGQGDAGVLGDTWLWNGTDWSLATPANSPPARVAPGMAFDKAGGVAVMFGGHAANGALFDDTWTWDGTTWTQANVAVSPAPRAGLRMAYDASRDRIVLYGGVGASDTWEWYGGMWEERTPAASPPVVGEPAMAYDATRREMLLFGGSLPTPTPRRYDGTWTYAPIDSAVYETFGTGCAGTVGIPALAPAAGQLPWIGDSFTVELTSLPPGLTSVPFGLLGLSNSTWMGNTLPFDLSIIGINGCSLLVSPDDAVQLLNTNGSSTWTLPIPNDPVLVGGKFFQQGLVLNPGANPLGATVTNGGDATMGAK